MAELKITLVNGQEAGATMQLVNKELREAKKALDKAVVGTEAYAKAQANIEHAEKNYEKVTKQIQGTQKASDLLKQAWNNLPGAQFFNQISDSFGMLKGGVGGLVSQFGVLKTAIISTGLGALIVIIGSLVAWMSKVEAITNVVKGAWEAATAAWGTFMNALATFDFTDLGDKMATAAKEGYNLVQVFDELEDKQRALDLSNEEAGKSLDLLLLRSRNVSLSYKERIALLDQADAIETNQHQKRLAYAKEYEAAVQREVDNAERQGLMNDELADKLVNAKKDVIAAEREDIALQEKIANRRAQLMEKQDADSEKRKNAEIKRLQDLEKARQEMLKREIDAINNTTLLRIQLMADGINKEIEQIQFDTQRKIEALVGSEQQIEEQRALLKQMERQRIQEATDAWEAQIMADAKAFSDEMQAQETAEANESWAKEKARLDAEKKAIQDKHDFEVALEQERMAMAQQAVGLFTDLLASQVKNEAAQKRIKKMGAVAEIGINLFRELSANAAYAATLGPAGPAYLALRNPPAYFRAAFATGRVLAFKKGGILRGPSHRDGGIDMMVGGRVAANAEGGEAVLTAAVSRNPRLLAAASHINVLAGGRPLMEMGGVVPSNPYAEVRNVTANSAQNASRTFTSDNQVSWIREEIAAEREAMLAKITTLRVVNDPTDTQKELDVINEIQNRVNV
ncbi:MAG: hypothetical protein O9302_00395 [Cyclobacteriaceae bacterium]|jgi:hypothetical protein|nr:hypothetical protein [Cytophagales bacterium]MCZ8326490.1 hypothetical protein [Cyclobacteriaceae bacterium]